jgi:lambda repressor-like predicted transcriptional regulator
MPPDPISLLPFSLFRSPSLCGLEITVPLRQKLSMSSAKRLTPEKLATAKFLSLNCSASFASVPAANAPRPDFIVAIFIVSFPITVWSGNYSAASSASPGALALLPGLAMAAPAVADKADNAFMMICTALVLFPGRRANAPRPDFIVAIFIVSFPITVWSGNYSAAELQRVIRIRTGEADEAAL